MKNVIWERKTQLTSQLNLSFTSVFSHGAGNKNNPFENNLQNQRLELLEAATEEISHVWKGTFCSGAVGLLIHDNSFRHLLSENQSRFGH